MNVPTLSLSVIGCFLYTLGAFGNDLDDTTTNEPVIPDHMYAALKARSIGPALMSGRIGDFAVHPEKPNHYYAAACSGGVWKTVNAGTTWEPIFDSQGSYSIGCLAMDPNNPDVLWVGTGENNSQRSVSFGDGIYRTLDGGKNWEHMGLKESEHIGMIAIHPEQSNILYVAVQGPLWRSGGDRGLYKSTDSGTSWERVLHISEDTGINEIHMDPHNPDVLYASSYQRRRHVWTLVNGGRESAIYKSTDAGITWRKLTHGIPEVDKGRIGLDISPADPNVIYAIIEAAQGKGGFFRSTNRGESWEKRSDYMTGSPQYYNEIVCDPVNVDRVYALDTFLHVTENGGTSFSKVPGKNRHVDDHALWINPNNTDHLLVGCDGGVYDSYDRGKNWHYKSNIPITQFYRVSADNSEPFYYVYGGTQDNNSQGGPSRTTDRAGITNADWFITVGGDGYETAIDPDDPNIVYSLWQYGGLVRHDRRSGEITDIKPQLPPGEAPLKWNWDSPLLLSPHHSKRLYFAANRLFRSDDQGNSWTAISEDMTRGIDRNKLKVMGRVQSVDAVALHDSTSMFGNIVSLTESPLVEGLLYVGSDDGLVHVTGDGGSNWVQFRHFFGVPEQTYVSDLTASHHDANTVYAGFDNHKMGDFKPYLLKSTDRGETWLSITGNLPDREVVYSIQEDHVNPNLLFVGTEFGAWFTLDGGKVWSKLKGLPTISVRDIEIQRRENDLVLGTFGRSIFILDDYTPLRHINEAVANEAAYLFPVKDALSYVERSRLGGRNGHGSQGAGYFSTPNPPMGAVFTYYLKEKIESRKEQRRRDEKTSFEKNQPVQPPSFEASVAEDREGEPQVLLVVRNEHGDIIRSIQGPRDEGSHRVTWNLRHPSSEPVKLTESEDPPPWVTKPVGPLVAPGSYTVNLVKVVDGTSVPLTEPVAFKVKPLNAATFSAEDKKAVKAFEQKVAKLQRAVEGAMRSAKEVQERIDHAALAITSTPKADLELLKTLHHIEMRLNDLLIDLQGHPTTKRLDEPTEPSIRDRVRSIVSSQWHVTSAPTQTHLDTYQHASEAFASFLTAYRTLLAEELDPLETQLEAAGAPWTPGRIPAWKNETE